MLRKFFIIKFFIITSIILFTACHWMPTEPISIPSVQPEWSAADKNSLTYNGKVYQKEGHVGKGLVQVGRFRLNENTYIDVIFYGKYVWAYVLMNDFAAYKTFKCDQINFILVDKDCDGIAERKIPACDPVGDYPEC